MSVPRPVAVLVAFLVAPLALARCGGTKTAATAPAVDSAPVAPPASTRAPPLPLAAPAMSWTPGTVQCGAVLCRARAEVCCGDGRCAAFASGKDAEPKRAAATCDEAPQKGAPQIDDRLKLCDDTSDCERGEVCCNEPWTQDRTLARCVRGKQGKNACALDESCLEGAPCATAGTQCVRGACRRIDVAVKCGGNKCRAGESCCGKLGATRCMPVRECAALEGAVEEYACTSPSHCPQGMTCVARTIGSFCTGTWDSPTTTPVCDTATDCPHALCGPGKGAPTPRCAKADERGLRLCRCPE